MRIAIIEDEIVAAQNIQAALLEYDPSIEVLAVLRSVAKAVEWLTANRSKVDLLLMDIKLTDGDSFDIFEQVDIQQAIIFTTAYDEYAIRAFKVNSVDYLLKPVSTEQLALAFDKWKLYHQPPPRIDYQLLAQQIQLNSPAYRSRFLVKQGNALRAIAVKDIAYFFAEGNLVLLRTLQNKSYPVNQSLDILEEQLDPQFFFRLTRNVIAHIQAIDRIQTYFKGRLKLKLLPPLAADIVVSSRKAPRFKDWANQ